MRLYAHEIPALMDGCEHRPRTTVNGLVVCWKCAGWHKVGGRDGRRIRRRLWQARILARLGGMS